MMESTILPVLALVDDDEDDRFFMRQALAASGINHKLIEFTNGVEFVNYLDCGPINEGEHTVLHLVILDINMPVMNGWEVLQTMRQHPVWQQVPVIVMAGHSTPNLPTDVTALGATRYIAKPSSIDELNQHVTTTIVPLLEQYTSPKG